MNNWEKTESFLKVQGRHVYTTEFYYVEATDVGFEVRNVN